MILLPASHGNAQPRAHSEEKDLSVFQGEVGTLYHKNYSYKEYNASFQNWGGIQDNLGVMVFANNDGVLTYDGTAWSLIETPTQSVIRSMAIDDDGKIFVGALDDFGYLERLKNGKLIYISLLDKLKPELHSMGNIWLTHSHQNDIYFESETGIFKWNGEGFEFWPWPNPDAYHLSFFWNGTLFAQEEGVGLMVWNGNNFSLAPNGGLFKNKRIYSALPLKNNKIQIATQFDGLFLYDGLILQQSQTQADSFFKAYQIYCGMMLRDGSFVYGTRHAGAVILNPDGSVRYLINNQNGLTSNIVLGLTLDREDNLWLSLDNGLSKFELSNTLSLYGANNGLEGAVNSFCRYNGKLYVGTNTGLYFLRPSSFPNHAIFEKIPHINMTCWGLLQVDNRMVISSNQGLFEMVGDDLRKITDHTSQSLHQCKGDSTRILVAINNQLQSLKLSHDGWREAGYIKDIKLDDINFNETRTGQVWLGTYSQGVALVSFLDETGSLNYDNPTVTFFGKANGLPDGFVKINSIGGEEIFRVGNESTIFKFNYATNRFKEDSTFFTRFGLRNDHTFPSTDEDSSGSLFFKTSPRTNNKRQIVLVNRDDKNGYEIKWFDISRIFEHVHVNTFHEKNIVWQGGADGIVRYELKETPTSDKTFNTFLNKIILSGDSILFQGVGYSEKNLTVPYTANSFRFEFTSTHFAAEEATEFQYKLEGYDDSWSAWTFENIKEYARLWEGDYRFLVRSRNYAEQIGSTAEFSFNVAPPWYRSFYAYAFYFIGAALFFVGVVKWRLRNLQHEKEVLQAEVAHQTKEIRAQNIQLAEQSEELKVNAEQLKALDKMKSNFFVNISHEFRTPLSLILGPLEKCIQENESSQIRITELQRMHRNARRLQQLINQLLDLAKLESGGMKLNPKQSDFIYFLRVLTSSFESLAESRNIQFEVALHRDSYQTCFDHEKVETILNNLLSNAFKFTPEGGHISVHVDLPKESEPISISISDSGPGIPHEEVDKIFDRFYQVDSSSAREFEGSGIGLSLVKELVHLMQGTVDVRSRVGKGTTFTIHLPLTPLASSGPEFSPGLAEVTKDVAVDVTSIKNHEQTTVNVKGLAENSVSPTDLLVLLVEDNADLRSYLAENLETEYQIAIAENGLLGFEKALELIPDLILSDMMMPIMDGFTLCTKIRQDERTSHIPFVLLTARTTIESKLEGLELGADEYITKPFNMKELKVRMKNLLNQRSQLRKSFSREVTVQPKNISITSVDERFLNHALEIMEAHLSDQQFSVERFAEEMGMSRKNLLRKITALTDQSVNEFIRNFRLQRAAHLLSGKSASVSEIAYQVGFNNLSYFSKCFKELFGVLPNEYGKSEGSRSEVSDSFNR